MLLVVFICMSSLAYIAENLQNSLKLTHLAAPKTTLNNYNSHNNLKINVLWSKKMPYCYPFELLYLLCYIWP